MAANAEIYFEHDRWGRALAWSAGLHVGLTVCILFYAAVFTGPSGDTWGAGGGGEAIGATLVSTVPLPAEPAPTQERAGERIQGRYAIAAQARRERARRNRDSGQEHKDKAEEETGDAHQGKAAARAREETNQVAFGEGGPVSGPYGTFAAGGAKGGFGITGGGGDFGTKFGWYVPGDSAEGFG